MKQNNILFLQFDLVIDRHELNDVNNFFGDNENMCQLFSSMFKSKLENSVVSFHNYDNVYRIGDNYYVGDIPLDKFDFVFFGFVKRYTTISTLLYNYLSKNKIPTLLYGAFDYVQNKAYDMELVQSLGYPYIPSILAAKINDSIINYIDRNFNYPVIVKNINLDKGAGVYKYNTKKDLLKKFPACYMRHFLIQKFIKNTGDYRVITFKNKAVLCVKKERTDEKEFRNNIAHGAVIIKADLPSEIISMCEDISKHVNCDIIGIDIIFDEVERKYYVMEINPAPGFPAFSIVANINVAEIIVDYIISNLK